MGEKHVKNAGNLKGQDLTFSPLDLPNIRKKGGGANRRKEKNKKLEAQWEGHKRKWG